MRKPRVLICRGLFEPIAPLSLPCGALLRPAITITIITITIITMITIITIITIEFAAMFARFEENLR